MQLNSLQRHLEVIYDLHTSERVEDFVLTDRALAGQLLSDDRLSSAPETLLISQDRSNLAISLFLDCEVLSRLKDDSPTEVLHDGNLEDFLTVVEGVSHFLYLIWNARFQRSVTQLELELQAEVDKFITTMLFIRRQYGRAALGPLHQTLFNRFRLRADLTVEQRSRYQLANRLASRYCTLLQRLASRAAPKPHLLAELRRFYRMPHHRKLRHIGGDVARPV